MTQSGENGSEIIHTKYEDLCRELNMDRETEELSWKKFVEISKKFSLEVCVRVHKNSIFFFLIKDMNRVIHCIGFAVHFMQHAEVPILLQWVVAQMTWF